MADSRLTALSETSVIALDDPLYTVDVSDTTDDPAGSSRKITSQRLLGLLNTVCQGRLTVESGVAVSTSDQTGKSNLYFTPYRGNKVALYDGSRWKLYAFSEVSLSLTSLTSGKNYDVFLYDNSGTLTLELSAAWTNNTTRADALSTQDGVTVKSGAATRRWLGTIRTTGATTTEDSATKRFVANAYNWQPRPVRKRIGTDRLDLRNQRVAAGQCRLDKSGRGGHRGSRAVHTGARSYRCGVVIWQSLVRVNRHRRHQPIKHRYRQDRRLHERLGHEPPCRSSRR